MRRVSGQPIREFLAENVCDPLGADYKIGVDEADLDRVADISPNPEGFSMASKAGPDSPLLRAWKPMPKPFDAAAHNTVRFRTGCFLSAGGIGTARAMARIYAALANGGEIDGVRLLSADAVARATTDQWEDEADGTTAQPPYRGRCFGRFCPKLSCRVSLFSARRQISSLLLPPFRLRPQKLPSSAGFPYNLYFGGRDLALQEEYNRVRHLLERQIW